MAHATKAAALAVLLALASAPAAADVVPDGGTATSAAVEADGRIRVVIAPVGASGISRNTFQAFGVPAGGVGLNNTGVGALTILNEVTSTAHSTILGTLEVLGPRAHVILANPNGITVDGGRFVNTGAVVLSAGTARLEDVGGRTDVVVGTGTGAIEIGPGGLAGTMTTLQLAAGRLRVDGAVVNENASPFASIALLAGTSELRLDSSVIPGSTTGQYATRTDLGGASDAVLVDVTPRGSLTASRVSVAVSAAGAGVSFAGDGRASIGEIRIDASGRVAVPGGTLRGEAGAAIAARSIAILNAPQRQGVVESLSGGVTLIAQGGDIDIEGRITGVRRTSADPASRGGVTLDAAGSIALLSEAADRLAIVFASEGDLVARAGGDIRNGNGRLLSNATVDLMAGGTVANETFFAPAPGGGAPAIVHVPGRRHWWSFLFGRSRTTITSWSFASPLFPGEQAFVTGAAVEIRAGRLVNTGEINALDGALLIAADRIESRATPIGTAQLVERCRIVCWSRGWSGVGTLGGTINSSRGLALSARSVLVDGGALLALGNLEIAAAEIVARADFLPRFAVQPGGLRTLFSGPRTIAGLEPFGGTALASGGSLVLTSAAPAIVDGGSLSADVETRAPGGIRTLRPAVPLGGASAVRIGIFESWLP